MGFRFRRSIRILPGVRVNLGKRGVSTSIGVRGAHVTLGKTGTRTTVGAPGTGLSYTHFDKAHPGAGAERPRAESGETGEIPRGRALRGWLWIVLIVAILMWLIVGR